MEIYICENMTSFFHLEILGTSCTFFNFINWFLFLHDVMQNHLILGYVLKPEVIEEMFQNNRMIRRLSF